MFEEVPDERIVLCAYAVIIALLVGIACRRRLRTFVDIWQELADKNADLDEVIERMCPEHLVRMTLGRMRDAVPENERLHYV